MASKRKYFESVQGDEDFYAPVANHIENETPETPAAPDSTAIDVEFEEPKQPDPILEQGVPSTVQKKVTTFYDLPPELREHVYAYYFEDLNSSISEFLGEGYTSPLRALCGFPYQPPLTQVSRIIRHESLPIFYKICSSYVSSTRKFFKNCPEAVLTQIRKLTFKIDTDFYKGAVYHIELDGKVRLDIDIPKWYMTRHPEAARVIRESLERRGESLSAELRSRGDKLQLKRADKGLFNRMLRKDLIRQGSSLLARSGHE